MEDGEHVAGGHDDVEGEGLAIDRALIAAGGAFELDLVGTPVNQDFVFHRSPSVSAAALPAAGNYGHLPVHESPRGGGGF